MAPVPAQRAAFDEVAALLQQAAAASARAAQTASDQAARDLAERHVELSLDRLALLYGRGTYENLATAEIVRGAVDSELQLAAFIGEPEAAAARRRAQQLVDAARRGNGLHVARPPAAVTTSVVGYVEPLRPELERSLWPQEQPYLIWRDGAVLILSGEEADALRAAGDEVDVLFLDTAEFRDLDARDDWPTLDAELGRRLAVSRAAPDRVADSRDRHVLRLLLRHSIVLRNLRDRLSAEHPGAYAGLMPVVREHTALLRDRLAAGDAAAGPGAAASAEARLDTLVSRLAAEPDDESGLRDRFRAVASAGTLLAELEQRDHR